MANERITWTSRIGFVLASAGAAVGLGAIWKFPYMAGTNGGSVFMLPYIFFTFTVGISLLVAELAMGRAGREGPMASLTKVCGRGWGFFGGVGVFTVFLILSFYSAVGGWCIKYMVDAVIGRGLISDPELLGTHFGAFVSDGSMSFLYMMIFLGITSVVVLRGIQGGIERVAKVLMPALFILMLIIIVRGLTLPGGLAGLEYLFAPRIDNLTSAFASLEAVADCAPDGIAVAFLADNEEVGSATKQGAGSTFLRETAERVYRAIGGDNFDGALAESLFLSVDNAHALHPNHPELSDPTNRTMPGKGVVIKRHANQNYTTDALSAAIVKEIFDRAGVKHQDFYMRSDLPCGGTLGAISSSQLSVRSCDVGLAQLAMHSAVETFCLKDYEEMKRGIKAFFESRFAVYGYGEYSLS